MGSDPLLESLISTSGCKSTCLGTRVGISLGRPANVNPHPDERAITNANDASSSPSPSSMTAVGALAAFSCQPEKDATTTSASSTSPFLFLLLTDGTSTFQGRIHPSEASKVPWNDHAPVQPNNTSASHDDTDAFKVQILASLLLEDKDRIAVSYDYTTDNESYNNKNAIKLVLRETLPSGIVRIMWMQTLQSTTHNLVFANAIATCLNKSLLDIQTLQQEKEHLSTDLYSWKDTATKLDRDWQQEKDALLHRFLELYKTSHEKLGKALAEKGRLEQELAATQTALAEAKEMAAASTSHAKRSFRLAPAAERFADMPDDHDQEEFDSEMVNMLAAGQPMRAERVPSSSRQTASGRDGSGTDSTATAGALGTAMRMNPHTGAKEIFDANAAFDDPAFLEQLGGGGGTDASTQQQQERQHQATKSVTRNKRERSEETGGSDGSGTTPAAAGADGSAIDDSLARKKCWHDDRPVS